MGAPPYSPPPIWHPDFVGKGICPAVVKKTQRCRRTRTCDLKQGGGPREQERVVQLANDLVYRYDTYSREERSMAADEIARLSVCRMCEGEGMRVEVRGLILQQLEREWALKRRGFACSLPAMPARKEQWQEDFVHESGRPSSSSSSTYSSPFSLSVSSRQGSSSPIAASTYHESQRCSSSSSSASSPFSLTLSTPPGSSPQDPSTITNDSSPPPTLPPVIPAKNLERFFFKTPPSDIRAANQQPNRPRSNPTPPSTPPNRIAPRTPLTRFRISTPEPPRANNVFQSPQSPSPETPSRRIRKPHTERQYELPTQDSLTIKALRKENTLLRIQLEETQNALSTEQLKFQAAKQEARKWEKAYWRLKDWVAWVFERPEEEEVEVEHYEGWPEDEDLGSPDQGDVDWPLKVPKKRECRGGERRRTRGMGSLGSIVEEDEEWSPGRRYL